MTFTEKLEVENWLSEVRSNLVVKTNEKSAFYEFDFYQGKPDGRSKRFEWVAVESDVKWMDRDPSTRPSHSTVFNDFEGCDSEEMQDIPEFEILL